MAPEMMDPGPNCEQSDEEFDEYVSTTASDTYSFSMTALEVLATLVSDVFRALTRILCFSRCTQAVFPILTRDSMGVLSLTLSVD